MKRLAHLNALNSLREFSQKNWNIFSSFWMFNESGDENNREGLLGCLLERLLVCK